MKFGDYIKNKREARSWSQPEASARADIEQSYLSKLERGKSYPSEDVFNRLVDVFDIDISEMNSKVFPGDLDRLREIKEVRVNLLERQKSARTIVRGWLMSGLVFLMLSGACFGVVVSSDGAQAQYYYRSLGVLTPDDPLNAYDIIDRQIPSDYFDAAALLSKQKTMLERFDPHEITTKINRGSGFFEDVADGKRYYSYQHTVEFSSMLRWFLVPALMFFFGSIASFFISFRWQ